MSFLGPMTAITNQIAAATASTTLFSASTCNGRSIYNSSTSIAYLTFGTVSSSTAYTTQLATASTYVFPSPTYCGPVTAAWASANGTAYTTQW
jgi:hypothetical protein